MFKNIKNDLPASVVVFFAALLLSLGIALANGAPLFSGIIAGIIGGIVLGPLSGSKIGVSGPAAGLAAIVLSSTGALGGFENFLVAVVLGGIIQLVFGILKAEIIGYYFPSSVKKGMLTGIGIIIENMVNNLPVYLSLSKIDLLFLDGGNKEKVNLPRLFNIYDIVRKSDIKPLVTAEKHTHYNFNTNLKIA